MGVDPAKFGRNRLPCCLAVSVSSIELSTAMELYWCEWSVWCTGDGGV